MRVFKHIAIVAVVSGSLLLSCENLLLKQNSVDESAGGSVGTTGSISLSIPSISPLIQQFYDKAVRAKSVPHARPAPGVRPKAYMFAPQATFTVQNSAGDTIDYWEYYSAGLELSENDFTEQRDIPIGRNHTLTVRLFNDKVSGSVPVIMGSTTFNVIGGTQSQISLQLLPNPDAPNFNATLPPGAADTVTLPSATYDAATNRITDFAAEWWYKIDTVAGQADPALGKAIRLTVTPSDTATVAFFAVFDSSSDVVAIGYSESDGAAVSTVFHLDADETYYVGIFPIKDGSNSDLTFVYQVEDNTPPTPYFQITPLIPEAGDSVTFDASGTTDPDDDAITSYVWDFGDGETGTGVVTTHEFATSEIYTVTLTVTDSEDNSESIEQLVIVDEPANRAPRALIGGASVIEVTQHDAVQFDASFSSDPDTGDTIAFAWDFDADGTVDSTAVSPVWTYAKGATYRVSLTVTDNDGAIDTDHMTVKVNSIPVAAISEPADGAAFSVFEGVTLDGGNSSDSDGTVDAWMWQITDTDGTPVGARSGVRPSYSFAEPGVYTVSLTVTDDQGATSAADQVILNVPNRPPDAVAGQNQYVEIDNTAYLDGTYSSDPDGQALTYTWTVVQVMNAVGETVDLEFDTSSSASFETPVITSSTYGPGTYEATLTVEDPLGLSAQDSTFVIVPTPDPADPIPQFSPPTGTDAEVQEALELHLGGSGRRASFYYEGVTYALVGRAVAFDVSRSFDPDGMTGVITFDWGFDFSRSPTYQITGDTSGKRSWIFPTAQNYVVHVNIQDDDGASAEVDINVTILPPPNQAPVADAGPGQTVEVEFDPLTTEITPVTVDFVGTGSFDPDEDALTYEWDFDDGSDPVSGAELTTPSHEYTEPGIYLVELTVTDDGEPAKNASDTMAVTVKRRTINYAPVAEAGNDITALEGEPFVLDGSGSYDPDGEITDYVWDVGGSVIASGSDAHRISHTIHTFGTYTATLTVTDNNGVAESSSVNLDIQEPPPLCFVFNVEHVGPRPFDEQHPIILAIYDRSYSRWLEYGPVLTLEVHQDGRYMMLISEMDPQYDPEDGEYALLVIHDLDGTGSPETNYWGFFQLGAADNISTSRASYTILELNEVLTTEYEFVFDDSNSGAIDLSI